METRLVEEELGLAGLRLELAAFERQYLETVGLRYAEPDEVRAKIAELLARRDPADPKAQKMARVARAQAEESRTGATDLATPSPFRFSPAPAFKTLYREVARRIHPDLALDDADRTKRERFGTHAPPQCGS